MIDYIYYKFYKFYNRNEGQIVGAIMAMAICGGLASVNLITVIVFLQAIKVLPIFDITKFFAIITTLFFFLLGYFVFLRKKKYIEIANRFKNETFLERQDGRTKVLLYVFASGIAFVLAAVFRYNVVHPY